MIRLKLPFWLDGTQLTKLTAAAQSWWERIEGWLRWPLLQMDPDTCHLTVLDLLAWQRDITRFKDEPEALYRLRLAVDHTGVMTLTSGELSPLNEPVTLLLAAEPTHSGDVFLRHKTSIRNRYDAAWKAAEAQGAFDMLFFNERDELTEGGRSSVFLRFGEEWLTPPLSAGVLPGVMRGVLLAAPAWHAREAVITREMLQQADDIVVCNALRGPLRAVLAA